MPWLLVPPFEIEEFFCVVHSEGDFSSWSADSLISLISSNVPIIVLDTHAQTIPEEPNIKADMGIFDNGAGQRNSPGDPFN
jgi:hypothetical protein